jgi:hypothetical protein
MCTIFQASINRFLLEIQSALLDKRYFSLPQRGDEEMERSMYRAEFMFPDPIKKRSIHRP